MRLRYITLGGDETREELQAAVANLKRTRCRLLGCLRIARDIHHDIMELTARIERDRDRDTACSKRRSGDC